MSGQAQGLSGEIAVTLFEEDPIGIHLMEQLLSYEPEQTSSTSHLPSTSREPSAESILSASYSNTAPNMYDDSNFYLFIHHDIWNDDPVADAPPHSPPSLPLLEPTIKEENHDSPSAAQANATVATQNATLIMQSAPREVPSIAEVAIPSNIESSSSPQPTKNGMTSLNIISPSTITSKRRIDSEPDELETPHARFLSRFRRRFSLGDAISGPQVATPELSPFPKSEPGQAPMTDSTLLIGNGGDNKDQATDINSTSPRPSTAIRSIEANPLPHNGTIKRNHCPQNRNSIISNSSKSTNCLHKKYGHHHHWHQPTNIAMVKHQTIPVYNGNSSIQQRGNGYSQNTTLVNPQTGTGIGYNSNQFPTPHHLLPESRFVGSSNVASSGQEHFHADMPRIQSQDRRPSQMEAMANPSEALMNNGTSNANRGYCQSLVPHSQIGNMRHTSMILHQSQVINDGALQYSGEALQNNMSQPQICQMGPPLVDLPQSQSQGQSFSPNHFQPMGATNESTAPPGFNWPITQMSVGNYPGWIGPASQLPNQSMSNPYLVPASSNHPPQYNQPIKSPLDDLPPLKEPRRGFLAPVPRIFGHKILDYVYNSNLIGRRAPDFNFDELTTLNAISHDALAYEAQGMEPRYEFYANFFRRRHGWTCDKSSYGELHLLWKQDNLSNWDLRRLEPKHPANVYTYKKHLAEWELERVLQSQQHHIHMNHPPIGGDGSTPHTHHQQQQQQQHQIVQQHMGQFGGGQPMQRQEYPNYQPPPPLQPLSYFGGTPQVPQVQHHHQHS